MTVLLVLTLLAYGCPVQAIVVAFGFDERTVKGWWQRVGQHCQVVHQHVVGQSQLDLQQVQANEIKVKTQGGTILNHDLMVKLPKIFLGVTQFESLRPKFYRRAAEFAEFLPAPAVGQV